MSYGDPPAYEPPRRSPKGHLLCNVADGCEREAVIQWSWTTDEAGNTEPVFGCDVHGAQP